MLTNHQTLRLKTMDGQMIEVEVNFNNNPKVTESKVLKFKFEGKEFQVSKDELVTLMLIVGDSQNQKQMLPMQTTRIRKYETTLGFEFVTTKDYRKGDKIAVSAPYIIEIPETEEMLSGNVKRIGRRPTKIY